MQGAVQLTGTVKHYDWGGDTFIPRLLDISNKENKPFAEYWLGVHPQADCRIISEGNNNISLREWVEREGVSALGEYVFNHFGNMPYLLKALDVKNMLSIQVHPSKEEAEKDFARENAAGIPLDSPERNYKDNNHKPELMVAMGPFWLLHGFKPADELTQTLQSIPELQPLLIVFQNGGYKELYRAVMEMPQARVNEQLEPLLQRIIPLYKQQKLDKSSADYWAAKAALTFVQPGKTDRGIFSVYLFNLVNLQRGEAIFQDAGVPHAYLEGQNIEIMASSDNVLRGGLTTKHIDVNELLKHVRPDATYPKILKGVNKGKERVYETPAPDFQLSSFELAKNETVSFTANTAEILLLAEGEIQAGDKLILKKGMPSAVLFQGDKVTLTGMEASMVFRAGVPV